MNKLQTIRALILDRDGVVNRNASEELGQKYILTKDELDIYDDFFVIAKWAKSRDIELFVVTNQQCVGLGLITKKQLEDIHLQIQNELQKRQLNVIREFYICAHVAGTCDCRKPSPLLLLELLSTYKFSPNEVLFIGDSRSDQEAAISAGINFFLLKREKEVLENGEIGRLTDLINIELIS